MSSVIVRYFRTCNVTIISDSAGMDMNIGEDVQLWYLCRHLLPLLATHVSSEAAKTNFVPVEVRLRGFVLHPVSVRQQTADPLQESQTVLFTPLV